VGENCRNKITGNLVKLNRQTIIFTIKNMTETKVIIPTVRPCGIGNATETDPVDLVIVIDTSPSMRDEAVGLSEVATAAISAAASGCPCDLRVTWFGIEGTWKGTNFNRTIQDYLIKECKVSESNIRARKRGELADAGAQEDAARTIEDISNHFDWRAGAARAIFYLGDEALEGGGDKTEEKDIVAANKAIQIAKQAGVNVHTYFGTSKSKFRESIQKEYARVSEETGGQAFTDRDSLNGFAQVLEKVICNSRPVGLLLDIDQPLPCFELRGDSQPLVTEGAKTIAVVASNCYSNVTFKGVNAVLSVVMKADGTPVPPLADGTPAVVIKPASEITFGDLLPISRNNSENSTTISKEVVIETKGANGAEYSLQIGYSYQAEFDFQGADDFAL